MSRKGTYENEFEIDFDLELALEFQNDLHPVGVTENAVLPRNMHMASYQPRTLIDRTLETLDPTPNIYTLFCQFNGRFFDNKLLSVEVRWSNRMTSCAGTCTFRPRSGECVIALSAPLLKLRPRSDLVETLLHEMIHGYLFLTNNNIDRDGHGPEFCKIMRRINNEAGTNITIYHTFHDEVRLYKQHWWRCNGPCQNRPPFFGTVRRAMNRAPGPNDTWWLSHQLNCNGTFIKIKEPEKKPKSSNWWGGGKGSENKDPKNSNAKPAIPTWFKPSSESTIVSSSKSFPVSKSIVPAFTSTPIRPKTSVPGNPQIGGGSAKIGTSTNNVHGWGTGGSSAIAGPSKNIPVRKGVVPTATSTPARPKTSIPEKPAIGGGLVKLGTSTNNVHGWGTGGPGSSPAQIPTKKSGSDNPPRNLNFGGKLGGSGTGVSNLLDKFASPSRSTNRGTIRGSASIEDAPEAKKPKIDPMPSINREFLTCPVCNQLVRANVLNDHLDICLCETSQTTENNTASTVIKIKDSPVEERGDAGKSKNKFSPSKGQTNLEGFVISQKKTDIVSCATCDKKVHITKLYEHMDNECSGSLPKVGASSTKPKETRTKDQSTAKNVVDLTEDSQRSAKPYTCLVCKMTISGNMALSDHLETCMQAIFNDDTFDVGNDSINENSPLKSDDKPTDKFPCPICMVLVQESLMNNHLDTCLLSENWD